MTRVDEGRKRRRNGHQQEDRDARTIERLWQSRELPTGDDADATYTRVHAACYPDSAIDVDEHARLITADVLTARTKPRNPYGTTTGARRSTLPGSATSPRQGEE